jgi:transcription initiation factor TFIIB
MSTETRCPDCGNTETRYVEGQGEIVCTICGLVLEEKEIEKKPYINENRKNQAAQPYLSEAGGQQQSGKIVKSIWLLSTREKNYEQAKKRLEMIASKLRLPQVVITDSNVIFKRAIETGLNIGRNNLSLLYGSVYAACIMHNVPKTPLEVTMYSEISKKKLMKTYRMIKKQLGLRLKTMDPADLVPRFGSRLGLKHETISKALEILGTIRENPLFVGKNPQTITASALYIAAKENGETLTQRSVANATGVIEVTIRKRSKEIIRTLEKSFS